MAPSQLQTLYPKGIDQTDLRGLYLAQDVYTLGTYKQPYIYANYVSSLDGRVAVGDAQANWAVPGHLTSRADWALFKELQAHTDCLVTHSGYLRALQRNEHSNILQFEQSDDSAYLVKWRQLNGLSAQPKILVVSRSLDFTLPKSIFVNRQDVVVLTGSAATQEKSAALQRQGVQVHRLPCSGLISANDVYTTLQNMNVRRAYLQTGPDLLHSVIENRLLSRLYLTTNLSLVGGDPFLSMINGKTFSTHARLKLRSLHLLRSNSASNEQTEQLFASFNVE